MFVRAQCTRRRRPAAKSCVRQRTECVAAQGHNLPTLTLGSQFMKTDSDKKLPDIAGVPKSLTGVLKQSENARELVQEAAEGLAVVNTLLKQRGANQATPQAVEKAREKSEIVENKVQDASSKLSDVNRALKGEVKERKKLDDHLATITEREEAARHMAFHDVLTGLPNRALFIDRLEHWLAQAGRNGRTLAVMFIDLDDFKAINDSHGHDAGDSVLQTIAERLRTHTRGGDTVSRHGGDEFLLLITEFGDKDSVTGIARNLLQTIQEPFNIIIRDLDIGVVVKASIGISLFPADGDTADVLVGRADQAMYRAKQGKSGYAFAENEVAAARTDRKISS